MRQSLLVLGIVLGLLGCMEVPKPEPLERQHTLYSRLGGAERLRRIVEDFLARAVVEEGLSRQTRERLARPSVGGWKCQLVEALGSASGGPGRAGDPPLASVLATLQLTAGESDLLVEAFRQALTDSAIPMRDQQELLEIFERACGQAMLT